MTDSHCLVRNGACHLDGGDASCVEWATGSRMDTNAGAKSTSTGRCWFVPTLGLVFMEGPMIDHIVDLKRQTFPR